MLSHVWLFMTLDRSPANSYVRGFPGKEYWSGLPYPTPADLPDPGIEPTSTASPALQEHSLPLSHLVSPCKHSANRHWSQDAWKQKDKTEMVVRQAVGLPKNGLWLPWSLQIQFEKHWPGRPTAILSTRRSGVLATLWAGWPSCEKLVLKGTEDKSESPCVQGVLLPFVICRMRSWRKQKRSIFGVKVFTHLFRYLVTEQSCWARSPSRAGDLAKHHWGEKPMESLAFSNKRPK